MTQPAGHGYPNSHAAQGGFSNGAIPTTTPPEIAKKIRMGRIVMVFGWAWVLLAPVFVGIVVLSVVLHGVAQDWEDERSEAQEAYERYPGCQGTKPTSLYCEDMRKLKKRPAKPSSRDEAPPWVAIDDVYQPLAWAGLIGAILSFLVGGAILLGGRAKRNHALRQDPSRVVIGHSRALEILMWIGMGFTGLVMIGLGASRKSTEMILFIMFGVACFAFAAIVQLALHAFRPSEADAEGFKLGFGRRLRWKDFVGVTSVTENQRDSAGNRRATGFHYKMRFKNGSCNVRPLTTSNWDRLQQFITSGVGKRVF